MPVLITYPLLTSITVIKVSMFEACYQYLATPLSISFPQLSLPEVVVCDLTRVLLPAIHIDFNITLSSRITLTAYSHFLGITSVAALATCFYVGYIKLLLERRRRELFPSDYIGRSTAIPASAALSDLD